MKLNSRQLKLLYQERTARANRDESECPGAEALLRATVGELGLEQRTSIIDHLVCCSDCAAEYHLAALARKLASTEAPSESSAVGLGAIWRAVVTLPRRPLAAALAVVLLAGLSITVWRADRSTEEYKESVRGGLAAVVALEPTDGSVLDEPPRRLAWSPVESAESYNVAVFDYLSTPLWESGPVVEPSVIIPESLLQRFERGRTVYWRVTMRRGIERQRSGLFQFSIRAD